MPKAFKFPPLLASLAAMLVLAGCSAPVRPTVYWPPPPEQPRLQWINTVYSEDSFDKTGFQVFLESFLGKPDLHFFGKPGGIAADDQGNVYVADMDLMNVYVYNFNEKKVSLLTPQPIFKLPIGLAVDSGGRIYVADGNAPSVVVLAPDRKPLFSFGSQEIFKKPAYLAVNERLGRIYVTDSQGHRVAVFNLEGNHLFSFGEGGNVEGAFFSPMGVAIDSKDRVFVADMLNARIQVFDPDGEFLYAFGERGDREWQFEGPRGLAFDSDDHLYIVDGRKSALMVYDPDGTLLLLLGGKATTHPLGFALPTGVWVDQNDRIYVSDVMNRAFSIWQYLSEDYLAKHPLDQAAMEELRRKTEKAIQKKEGP